MKTITVLDRELVLNPQKTTLFVGKDKSLFEIFNKINDDVQVLKELLFISSHYFTYRYVQINEQKLWAIGENEVKFYTHSDIEGSDLIYYDDHNVVASRAFLQDSVYYKGTKDGIFANEINSDLVSLDGPVKKLMDFLENNDYTYICYDSFSRDKEMNIIQS